MCTRAFFGSCLVLRRIKRKLHKKINSDCDYFHALFGLSIERSSPIRCAKSFFCPVLIIRRMQRHCEKKKISAGAYFMLCLGY